MCPPGRSGGHPKRDGLNSRTMKEKRRKTGVFAIVLAALFLVWSIMPCFSMRADAADDDPPAAGKTVQLVGSGDPSKGIKDLDHIWLGTIDDENYCWTDDAPYWRVLDADQMNTEDPGMFLMSEGLIANNLNGESDGIRFLDLSPHFNKWQGSDAQLWCGAFLTAVFSGPEQNAIAPTYKSDPAFSHTNEGSAWGWSYSEAVDVLKGDKVFFLSAEESTKAGYGLGSNVLRTAKLGSSPQKWWLRTPYELTDDYSGAVSDDGALTYGFVREKKAVRPAFNLDLSSVLFSTKVSSDPDTYKLTVIDKDLKIDLPDGQDIVKDGSTITAHYVISGKHAAGDTKALVMITDKEYMDSTAQLKYYGELPSDGTIDLENDEWRVYLIAENRNGVRETDYASKPVQIYPHVHRWIAATCTEPKICSLCHEISGSALGHRWDEGKVTRQATAVRGGETTFTCLNCGLTRTEPIPKAAWKANPLKIKAKKATIKYSDLKKKSRTLKVSKVIKFTKKGKGKMSYKLVSAKKRSKSFKKYFKVASKSGKVTVKKGLKKGTYKVKMKVKATGNEYYRPLTVPVTFKVIVK